MPKTRPGSLFAILDRDGTINANVPYLGNPDELALLPGAVEGLHRLATAGFRLIIATNQSGIGRGHVTHEMVEAVHTRLLGMLAVEGIIIERIYICPHGPDDNCECRKPRPGLMLQAQRELGIDFAKAIVFGDQPSDMGMAAAAGVPGVLICGDATPPAAGQIATARDLDEGAAIAIAELVCDSPAVDGHGEES
jgi:D-glycero-D-manno-heptose 1,7-bisphosphate phosphatase